MVFNTATIGTAVTPAVVGTFFSHYLNRGPRAEKPTAHISYDEGLNLIRRFLLHVSHHTVEDIQGFTAQWVPHPTWVKVDIVKIPKQYLTSAAEALQAQLGHHGIERVGGKTWWQWRRPGNEMHAEWIEMKSDYTERKKNKDPGKRVMFYVHGGAYFFGSVDMHRYQLQRHARKLRARVFARDVESTCRCLQLIAEYRLAPQFPFPCGLHDCLAAYLYLLTVQDPTTIVFAGDSAGGGMIVSLLVTLRDRGLPLPAGAILISPWVDLTHSFPSVSADCPLDYIPANGFHQRPSAAWPPPTSDDMLAFSEGMVKKLTGKEHVSQAKEDDAVQGFHINSHATAGTSTSNDAIETAVSKSTPPIVAHPVPRSGQELSIMIDGKLVEIKDQIQMYASNQLISHSLVSPILQPSLGGLPPLLILTGGGEMLRDEQIYLAHKAANPAKYPPGDAFLDENPHDHKRDEIGRWKPTDVQLQVWDDLCHVAPTLSFTRPAKYMYRSVAQFGAWALARAQQTEIEILDDDAVSIISDSEDEDAEAAKKDDNRPVVKSSSGSIGRAGDPLPAFRNHMIRQRVDLRGEIFPLDPPTALPGCKLAPNEIGVIKEGPVRKWMASKLEWDTKFATSKRRVQKQRAKEIARGYHTFGDGEVPPPSALAGRRRLASDEQAARRKKSVGMMMWSGWGSKHDKATMDREHADLAPETSVATAADGANARPLDDAEIRQSEEPSRRNLSTGISAGAHSRSRSRRRTITVTDEHQTEGPADPVDPEVSAAGAAAVQATLAREKLDVAAPEKEVAGMGGDRAGLQGVAASPVIARNGMRVPLSEAAQGRQNGREEHRFPVPLAGPAKSPAYANVTTETVAEKSDPAPLGRVPTIQIAGDNSNENILATTTSQIPPEKTTIMANEIIRVVPAEKPNGAAVEKIAPDVVDSEALIGNAVTTPPADSVDDHATEPVPNKVSEKAITIAPKSTATPDSTIAPQSAAAPESTDTPASTATPVVTAAPVPKVNPKPSNASAPKTKGRLFSFGFRRKSTPDAAKPKETVVAVPSIPAAKVEVSSSKRKSFFDNAKLNETAAEAPSAPAKAVKAAGISRRKSIMDFASFLKGPSAPATKVEENAQEMKVPPLPVAKAEEKANETKVPALPTVKADDKSKEKKRPSIPAEKVEEKAKEKKRPSIPAEKVEEKAKEKKRPSIPAAKAEEKAEELASPLKAPVQAPAMPTTETTIEPAQQSPTPNGTAAPIPTAVEPKSSKKKSVSNSDDISYPETSQSTRPKSRGIAFPFSLKRSATKGKGSPTSSASVTTLTSVANIPPAPPVETKAAAKDAASEVVKEAAAKPNGTVQKAEYNEGIKSAPKAPAIPPPEVPKAKVPVPQANHSEGKPLNPPTDVDDYLTW